MRAGVLRDLGPYNALGRAGAPTLARSSLCSLSTLHGTLGGANMTTPGGADLLLAISEQEDEQRLREAGGERRSFHLRGDESPYGEAFGPQMRLFRQFHTESG